jgi:DNA-binding NarL/FixJ family response regulator
MGYFSNLALEIEQAVCEGATVTQIAGQLNISEAEVIDYIEQLDSADRDTVYYGA